MEVAKSIGKVVDIGGFLPQSGISAVQTLRPHHKGEAGPNQYSGAFGLGDFPLHTDLAHWARPPRYFLLRCRRGSPAVMTRLLATSVLASAVGRETLERALVRPRRPQPNGMHSLLPIVLPGGDTLAVRWDSLFLVPMNEAARRISEIMMKDAWCQSDLTSIALKQVGDILILDNWCVLHGRSSIVCEPDCDRWLERVYISELHP